MSKLLYLAYPFPPARFVACIRTWNTAAQLSRLGWDVTVVTPHPSLWRRAATSDSVLKTSTDLGLHLIHTGHAWPWLDTDNLRTSHPRLAWALGGPLRRTLRHCGEEGQVGWISEVKRAITMFRPGMFDAILATGSPFGTFSLARQLSEQLECPYVLDYRDLWTTDNPHKHRSCPSWIQRRERRSFEGASAVTVVSRTWGEMLVDAFGHPERVHIVSNGYSADELEQVKPHPFPEPAILYAGGFYPPKRVLHPVMKALRPLDRPDLRWKFHYCGVASAAAEAAASKAGVRDRLVIHGEVSRPKVLSMSKGAHCAVVITSVEENETRGDRGIVTGKVFELVGMGTPVLLVAPPHSDAEEAIRFSGCRFSGSQVSEMEKYLDTRLNGPRQSCPPPPEFEWHRLGLQFDQVMRSALCK